mmetsp:Transcript_26014/g.68285  ORF Transcript_26014/g.68285 Transcript_26014/m.68285 type:complete len:121 (-) Transcript_26014:134-496(-)
MTALLLVLLCISCGKALRVVDNDCGDLAPCGPDLPGPTANHSITDSSGAVDPRLIATANATAVATATAGPGETVTVTATAIATATAGQNVSVRKERDGKDIEEEETSDLGHPEAKIVRWS